MKKSPASRLPVLRDDGLCRVVCFNERKIEKLRRQIPAVDALGSLAAVHKALSHPGRLAVLRLVAIEECCVCDVANVLRLPVSTASQHLKALREAGLLRSRQDGKLVFHSLAREALAAVFDAEARSAR